MSAFATAVGAPLVRVAGDGKTYEFRKLKRTEIGRLLVRWAAEGRAALVKRLDECQLPPDKRWEHLTEFDDQARRVSYGYRCLFDYERAIESVGLGYLVNGLPAQECDWDALPFTPDELVEIACAQWGFDLVAARDAQKSQPVTEAQEQARPLAPTATGS